MTNAPERRRHWLYLLFAISGFSGLIYESIWSHYLKLFLGHAAYAQTLVLAIFMGGMAIGAWIPSRWGVRWRNLLLRYAIVEAVIGVCAIVFHKLFVGATDLAYDSLIPVLAAPWAVTLFKWSLAAMLILPQSILLGMTFPLMSASVIRRYPATPGASLAMLYFTNSLGAAIGVLVSGFVLIEAVGLPGTILTAGLINIAVALVAWSFAKDASESAPAHTLKKTARHAAASWRLLIAAAFVTGAASFIYEIGWIRMLSLVLGSSTHAFELMLSAFIVGLAFGGLWIRRRIDDLKQPVQFLGWIQVAMGLLALLTLVAYNGSFDLMRLFMRALTPTDGGYLLFNLASHSIAVVIMVPVTFCAGMTLPLITHTLLRSSHGEKSIGAVYAANTLGAIVGVFFAVHIGLSTLGLKGLISAGAVLDMGLGIVLLGAFAKLGDRRSVAAASLLCVVALAGVLWGVELDRYKMASGVYRHGAFTPKSTELLYHKDGKTATVDLLKLADGNISLRINGKTDAQMSLSGGTNSIDSDESTMILLAAIPLLHYPNARTAANIGIGSGLTTHVLLSSTNLEHVDTIEIESAMIEAAHGFRPRVERTYSDPRSRLHVEDAKTFFSGQRHRYDIIVAEPSNPWVSGVASLFSDEFYHRTRAYLNPNGLFVQWLQLYEIDIDLVASVMKAIGRNFSDYTLYMANDVDLIIVAVTQGSVPTVATGILAPGLAQELRRIGIHTLQDFTLGHVGDRKLLEPLFEFISVPVNSDFFPIVDLHAVRARFLKSEARELLSVSTATLPIREMLSQSHVASSRPTRRDDLSRVRSTRTAIVLRDFYRDGTLRESDSLGADLLRDILIVQKLAKDCRPSFMSSTWFDSVANVIDAVMGHLKSAETESLWQQLRLSDCYHRLTPGQRNMFRLYGMIARRDATNMATLAEKLLDDPQAQQDRARYLLSVGMLGNLARNRPQEAIELWAKHAARVFKSESPDGVLRLLLAHSILRVSRPPAKTAAQN